MTLQPSLQAYLSITFISNRLIDSLYHLGWLLSISLYPTAIVLHSDSALVCVVTPWSSWLWIQNTKLKKRTRQLQPNPNSVKKLFSLEECRSGARTSNPQFFMLLRWFLSVWGCGVLFPCLTSCLNYWVTSCSLQRIRAHWQILHFNWTAQQHKLLPSVV